MTLKIQVMGLNNILSHLYRTETRLSTLLEHLGFSTEQLVEIRTHHLELLTLTMIEFLRQRVAASNDGERRADILNRRFGLDAIPPITLETLGTQWEISRERIRQLEERALRSCRRNGGLAELEDLLLLQASVLVGDPENEPPPLESQRLRLPPSHFKSPADASSSTAKSKEATKTYSVKDIRETHTNAYAKWSDEDDQTLRRQHEAGMSVPEIAVHFGRKHGAIRSRLRKLEITK